jgi:hypothetical protein
MGTRWYGSQPSKVRSPRLKDLATGKIKEVSVHATQFCTVVLLN